MSLSNKSSFHIEQQTFLFWIVPVWPQAMLPTECDYRPTDMKDLSNAAVSLPLQTGHNLKLTETPATCAKPHFIQSFTSLLCWQLLLIQNHAMATRLRGKARSRNCKSSLKRKVYSQNEDERHAQRILFTHTKVFLKEPRCIPFKYSRILNTIPKGAA